jgi:hypothetical protein
MQLSWPTSISLFIVAGAMSATAAAIAIQTTPWNADRSGLAVDGYDVVAYTTDGAAIRGRAEFEYRWQNVVWRFASGSHRDEFARSPERFAPQFGGYCAWAVSRGYTADVDPHAWRIVDGKLYLNYSKRVQQRWEQDVAGNIAKGHRNWPGVLAK